MKRMRSIEQKAFGVPLASRDLRDFRRVDDGINLLCLAREWGCIVLIAGGAIAFAETRETLGLHWGWNIPVFLLATTLLGALQHRLAMLGHDASHGTLLSNRLANDLAGDLFCMFPILATLQFYRRFHMPHHQYTNDPELDSDLVNLGRSTRVAEFPMPAARCILLTYFRWLCDPLSVIRYQGDYLYVMALGKGENVYSRRLDERAAKNPWPDPATLLGIASVLAFVGLVIWLIAAGWAAWIGTVTGVAVVVGTLGTTMVPERWLYRSPFRQRISTRASGALRLAYYLLVIGGLAALSAATGGRAALYFALLWLVPLGTSFSYFMLVRDIYQHTNADTGRLTNSRIFFTDAFTKWAILGFGQDMHLTHHLHVAVPHHNLAALHRHLQETDPEYRENVVECHGTFRGDGDAVTILDELTRPRMPVGP